MEKRKILDLQEQPLRVRPEHHRERHQSLVAKRPWWRSRLVGYFLCLPLIGIALLTELVLGGLGPKVYTVSAVFYLVNVVIAWLWGVGPALLAILLGYIVLESLIIPPKGVFTFNDWSDITVYFPFIVTQVLVVLITVQRERAQRQALVAEREAEAHVRELAEANQALAQSNQQLEQLNSQLEEVNQLKDIFFSRASHELKTPVTTIRGQAQFALRRLAKSQQAASGQLSLQTHLEKIDIQTHRLHGLIDDLLDMSSLSSGKIPLRLAPCDLGSLCREVVEDQRALSGPHVELELPSEPIMLQADCQRLIQVIINLVSNAVKYSPENTTVRVCVSQQPLHALLTVHNNGSAIPQERQTHIFEPFYRAPEAERSPIQGWGLGLSISKEIVERHGGEIGVESTEEKGTTFFVRLPLQAPT